MRHEDDGLGAVLDGILDGGQRADDALVVGDVLVAVERDVEVDLEIHQYQLPRKIKIEWGRDLHGRAHACP